VPAAEAGFDRHPKGSAAPVELAELRRFEEFGGS
jgi:hypothetical protein